MPKKPHKLPLVTDLPVWDDHPWPALIPANVVVRRGLSHDQDMIALVRVDSWGIHHVDFDASLKVSDAHIRAALTNLGAGIR